MRAGPVLQGTRLPATLPPLLGPVCATVSKWRLLCSDSQSRIGERPVQNHFVPTVSPQTSGMSRAHSSRKKGGAEVQPTCSLASPIPATGLPLLHTCGQSPALIWILEAQKRHHSAACLVNLVEGSSGFVRRVEHTAEEDEGLRTNWASLTAVAQPVCLCLVAVWQRKTLPT